MSQTTEMFIRAFEEIKAEVNHRAGEPGSHSFEIERASVRDGSVGKNRALLIYIRDVRNALQHPKHRSGGPAVQVSEGFLREVQSLLKHLKNPPTANSLGVSRAKLKVASLNDTLGDLADQMKQGSFSHVPILDERDVVIGVFNEAAVFDHLLSEAAMIIEREMKISDILANCRLDANHTETFKFVNPRTPRDELVDMFRALESAITRIGAIFVTPSGKQNEPVHRLITPWDVLAPTADS